MPDPGPARLLAAILVSALIYLIMAVACLSIGYRTVLAIWFIVVLASAVILLFLSRRP